MLSADSQLDSISLSAGGQLNIPDWQLRGNYPAGTEAQLVVTDDAGAVLATFDGTSTNVGIYFLEEPDAVKDIPHGANFQLFITKPGEDAEAARYGKIVRKEPRYPLAEIVQPEDAAKQYTANFAGKYIGPMWVPMGGTGTLAIHDNSAFSLPPSMGPNFGSFLTASARWLFPMNMDSVTINTNLLNVSTGAFGYGVFNIIVCSDYAMTSYLGVQLYVDVISSNSYVQVIKGSGPTTWAAVAGTKVSNTFAQQGAYSVKYNALSNTLALYKGANLSPLLTWVDTNNLVPKGPGFRYTGLSWQTALFAPVLEPTAWEAKDGV